MKITITEKIKTIIVFLALVLIMGLKWIVAKFVYPFAYLLKDWVYGDDEIKNYHMPSGPQKSWIKWFFWLFLDDDQPIGYSERYAVKVIGHKPKTKWEHFWAAYRWSGVRNPAYNINYYYFSTRSNPVYHQKVFGKYDWDTKLRTKKGHNGAQLVWFKTEKEQVRFLFSLAIQKINLTFFFGWNASYNGRITLALRFREKE